MYINRLIDRRQAVCVEEGWNEHDRLGPILSHPFGGKKVVTFPEHIGKRTWKQNRGPTIKDKGAQLVP